MDEKSVEYMTFESSPVLIAVCRQALPTVTGQIILVLYNMADMFFIGMTGSDAKLTAVTICMPALMFLSAISNLFGVGGASEISRALGRRQRAHAAATAAFVFWACLLGTALYSAGLWLFMDVCIDLLGGTASEVHGYTRTYLVFTVVFGGAGASMSALLAHLLRSEGRSLQASVGIMAGGVLNILLDPLFMFWLMPAGEEVAGAALATALSNFAAAGYFLVVIWKRKGSSILCFRLNRYAFSGGIVRCVLSTGSPACVMTLFENISYAILGNLMALHGTTAQAGIGVAKKVNMLAHCITRGMAQGVLPLIAYNYAAKNFKRMKSIVHTAKLISVALAVFYTGICLLFSSELIGIFIQEGSSSLRYGTSFLKILSIGGPFSAYAYSIISFFQAVNCGQKSFILAILRKGVLDVPLMFLLRLFAPIYGLVWATPIADGVCCIAAIMFFLKFIAHRRENLAHRSENFCVALGVNSSDS